MRIKLTFCDFTESKFEEGEHELTNELCSSNRSDMPRVTLYVCITVFHKICKIHFKLGLDVRIN